MTVDERLARIAELDRTRRAAAVAAREQRSPELRQQWNDATAALVTEVRAAVAHEPPTECFRGKERGDPLSLRGIARHLGLSYETLRAMVKAQERREAGLDPWPLSEQARIRRRANRRGMTVEEYVAAEAG